jgi:hypothetical protein
MRFRGHDRLQGLQGVLTVLHSNECQCERSKWDEDFGVVVEEECHDKELLTLLSHSFELMRKLQCLSDFP